MAKLEINFNQCEYTIKTKLKGQLKNNRLTANDIKNALEAISISMQKDKDDLAKVRMLGKNQNFVTRALVRKIVNRLSLKTNINAILVEYMTKICKDKAEVYYKVEEN